MIVRTAPGGVHVMTQPDHARLARAIMERCSTLHDHPRRDAILFAVGEHDNGWTEEDAAPSVIPSTGRVADFVTLPVAARQAVWPRGVGRLADSWPAALVAHHAVTVYERFRGDASWASFFSGMESMRDSRLRASGLSFDNLASDYPFVRLGDLISLAFCTGSSDEQRFGHWTVKLAGADVRITPDPFGGAVVPIEIVARELPSQQFATDDDLRAALRGAHSITLRGHARGA
jgi:hypothetical protein